ncbi:hypothetical protein ID866_12027 [Astraeus odoratus]|nr:hypothetical protein ID866_12027 [Astraeus odoratus]
MHLCTHTQTKHKDAKHYLSGSCKIPSMSDCHPPLSACHSSPTTPHHKPCIRTLAEELEDAQFRTPDSPRGSDPDPGEPDDPDDNDSDNGNNASDPSIKDNPLFTLTSTIFCLSCATRLQAFDLDSWKAGFALSFLKGIALTWFKPDLLNSIPGAKPAWADDYSEFIIELTTNFGPHNPVGDAEHQLNNLSMKDSSHINKYIVEFNHLATQVHGYGEGALQHMFYNRLPDHIKDEITHGIDTHSWEHKSEIAHQAKTNPQPSSSSKQSVKSGCSR